jgi:hypothetical protein
VIFYQTLDACGKECVGSRILIKSYARENLIEGGCAFFAVSQRASSFDSLVRSLKLCTCESRFVKKNKRSAFKNIVVKMRSVGVGGFGQSLFVSSHDFINIVSYQ